MAKEIERKFLVDSTKLPLLSNPKHIIQGYIPAQNATLRVRISNDKAYLTLKGRAKGLSRSEFEYEIPLSDAKSILEELCIKPYIEKKRYIIPVGKHKWELDIFEGANDGLIVAEIELESEDEEFIKPDWISQEVSFDSRYRNSALINNPYSKWQ
jgi:adenylate cyclase